MNAAMPDKRHSVNPPNSGWESVLVYMKQTAGRAQAPKQGSRWRHPRYSGTWIVTTVGTRYITLSTSVPGVPPMSVDMSLWPGSWELDAR